MKTKSAFNKAILETKRKIQGNYPELSKFVDEMTITIPDKETPEINASPRSLGPSLLRSLLSAAMLSGVCNAGRFAKLFAVGCLQPIFYRRSLTGPYPAPVPIPIKPDCNGS